ncbi:MAG TPA: sensor histidine kinase [Solirubrobacteraceae bacterium]|nr:sensor histidine kinase [Solirubrobacteraceae bacterium]
MTSTVTTSTRDGGSLVHAALLYRRPDQLRVALDEFLRDGAAAGESCLVALPPDHLEQLGEMLHQTGATVRLENMADLGRNPARLIPSLLDWLDEQPAPARVVSEALWPGRSYAEVAECMRHEALLNVALAGREVSVLCPYDAEHLDGEVLAGAELTHPQLIDDVGTRPSMRYGDPVQVAAGSGWPQAAPAPPVTDLAFDGDLGQLRHALAADPLLAELDPARRDDLVFAVNEAASNALRHGDGLARARLWRDDNDVVGEISTTTPIDDPLAGRRTPDPAAAGGRGLWLINQVCDLVEVRSDRDGASVRMHVALTG